MRTAMRTTAAHPGGPTLAAMGSLSRAVCPCWGLAALRGSLSHSCGCGESEIYPRRRHYLPPSPPAAAAAVHSYSTAHKPSPNFNSARSYMLIQNQTGAAPGEHSLSLLLPLSNSKYPHNPHVGLRERKLYVYIDFTASRSKDKLKKKNFSFKVAIFKKYTCYNVKFIYRGRKVDDALYKNNECAHTRGKTGC